MIINDLAECNTYLSMFKQHFYTNWTTEKGKQFGITVYTS